MITRAEHEDIQAMIEKMPKEDLQDLYVDTSVKLSTMSEILDYRSFTPDESKATEIFVEILLRIEAFQQNKGWWFRTKRRMSLIKEYLSK
ncbi:hypothetical protein [Candidatus Sulfurimonas baltica]|uniref:Uncharacterized protein n=1 Tax=Candidatus Sulfurimonas baltica TaxID=2740404 RepID=A0A7S7LTW2_9BACT|nr:hypothetical protein [Candidatus Sulfurimonas baltica]QOY51200.1 hypothetical protein HUE88_08655 [Candidatus Sulfurimonas baltica]